VDDLGPATVLFEAAATFLREQGMKMLLGPMSFTTNDEVGILVEGFESLPYIMTPYNFPYYGTLVEQCGGEKARDLYTYHVESDGTPPGFITRISAKVRKSSRITVREVNLKRFSEELELVKKIYNAAWERNWGFVPMTDDEIRYLAKNLKPILDPALMYFAFVEKEPAGFFMALPDYNVLLKEVGGRLFPFGFYKLLFWRKKIDRLRVLAMGVVKRFRHLGIEAVFLDEIFRKGPSKGYRQGELSWILEDNSVMNRISSKLSGRPSRTYRIYQKQL
jgi:GNAT superfamily N-acetyltransferase